MVLIRRQMKARQNSEGHRLPTWLSGERHKDPCRIKQTFECLVLKTVNSIHADWIYAARLGSQCYLHLWISTTCSLPEPWGHWHPWNPCQPLQGGPVTLPMVQEPISAQLSPLTSWYSGLASDATAASGHVQAALVTAGDGLWMERSCLAALFPVSSISPREQPALAQHKNLHKIWSCRTSA